jgi:hypothetical protein
VYRDPAVSCGRYYSSKSASWDLVEAALAYKRYEETGESSRPRGRLPVGHSTRVFFPAPILAVSKAATLLDIAERWITPHFPAAAQSAEGTDSSTSRIRTRAFDLVAGNQKLPVRIQNIC